MSAHFLENLNKMKISHEVPIVLLTDSLIFNDYHYCLVHLLVENEFYYNFFKERRDSGDYVIMDNSIFELGKAYDSDRYARWIIEMKPDEYIIPDSIGDVSETVKLLREWIANYSLIPGKKIGVLQGQTYTDLIFCYIEMNRVCDKIAIPFHSIVYLQLFPHSNKLVSMMMGRILLINMLIKDKVINKKKPHHLLGCSLPQEFSYYKGKEYNFIESLDTSNPVMAALSGISYNQAKLFTKPKRKIIDVMDEEMSEIRKKDIYKNINEFKTLIR